MPIAAAASVLPDHYYDQETLIAAVRDHCAGRHHNIDRIESIYRHTLVNGRYLALPIEEYDALQTFADANTAFIKCAVNLGEQAIQKGLQKACLEPKDIDHLIFVSITGIATPSVDALLVNRMNLRRDIKRTPIFGLGCMAGASQEQSIM